MEQQERERGEPEITQVYDVKTKLKREGKGGRREKERDEISPVDAFFGDRFLRALLFSLLFSLTSFSSGHAARNPLFSPVELSLFQHTARTMAKRRQKCLRRCIHNGTGQNNSTDVFRRWKRSTRAFFWHQNGSFRRSKTNFTTYYRNLRRERYLKSGEEVRTSWGHVRYKNIRKDPSKGFGLRRCSNFRENIPIVLPIDVISYISGWYVS